MQEGGCCFQGLVATDGSLLLGQYDHLKVAGWCVASPAGKAAGPAPFMEQEILLAEAWAVLMLLRLHFSVEEVCIDNAAVVASFNKGRQYACGSGRPPMLMYGCSSGTGWRMLDCSLEMEATSS